MYVCLCVYYSIFKCAQHRLVKMTMVIIINFWNILPILFRFTWR